MGLLVENSEKRLVFKLRDGSHAAMQEFYAQYGSRLTALCSRYIADDDDLKDVMQEAMITIFVRVSDFEYRGKGSLLAWVSRVVINEALKFLRQRKKEGWISQEDNVPDIADDDPNTDGIPPEVLHDMIRHLPDGYRMVFNLYVIEDMSHEEIAQKLGIKRDTSASQLHRAKKMLARMVKEYLKRQSR